MINSTLETRELKRLKSCHNYTLSNNIVSEVGECIMETHKQEEIL